LRRSGLGYKNHQRPEKKNKKPTTTGGGGKANQGKKAARADYSEKTFFRYNTEKEDGKIKNGKGE